MSRLTQKGQGAPLTIFSSSTDTSLTTMNGARFDSSDGREFVLALVGAANIGPSLLVQSPANVANHQNLATTTASAGATSVTVTLGGTAATANQYAGGYFITNAGTGAGQCLKIASHPAQSSGSGTLVLTLEDPLLLAVATADTKSCLLADPCNGVIVSPATTLTGKIVGATLYALATATYGLLQTKGPIGLYSESNIATTPGAGIIGAAATAGWSRSATGTTGFKAVGSAVIAAVSAEARTVWLDL